MRSSPLNDQSGIQGALKTGMVATKTDGYPHGTANRTRTPPYLGRSDRLGTRTEQPLSSKGLRSYAPIAAVQAKGSSL